MKNWKSTLPIVLSLLLLCFGGFWFGKSLHKEPSPVPLPKATISVAPTVQPEGPREAAIPVEDANEIDQEEGGTTANTGDSDTNADGEGISVDEEQGDNGDYSGTAEGLGTAENPIEYNPATEKPRSGNTTVMTPEKMKPNRLFIPALGVYSKVEKHSIVSGALILNNNPKRITQWREGASVSSKEGSMILAGHVTYNTTKGSLYHLSDLKAGNMAYVTDTQGRRAAFKMTSLHAYTKADLPTNLWNKTGDKKLYLVTCGGKIIHTSHGRHYKDNVVAGFVPAN